MFSEHQVPVGSDLLIILMIEITNIPTNFLSNDVNKGAIIKDLFFEDIISILIFKNCGVLVFEDDMMCNE